MNCDYFGVCGGCVLFNMGYEEQLSIKVRAEEDNFKDLYTQDFEIIKSNSEKFRSRAEFKIYHDNGIINYAMTTFDKKYICINECQIVNKQINTIMKLIKPKLQDSELLHQKLFSIEFMSSIDEVLVTLIYHKKLDEDWIRLARILQDKLNIKIIGRSRGQKLVLSEDYITQEVEIENSKFKIIQKEGGFSQPNSGVNRQMLDWVMKNANFGGDLCELYCGGGNFTIPLSSKFKKVLATEISKTSINSAKISCELNNIKNIEFLRMSSEDFTSALNKTREFVRLKDIDLANYNFSTIFIDPPRAGVDEKTLELVSRFENIIYISCNPITLKRDLEVLIKTHKITKFAFFDQFAWTNHIESGVFLNRG